MESLRTRRSQAPPRKAQRSGTTKLSKSSNSGGGGGGGKNNKSRVDDKIKKRMSMRYADISGPTALSVPDVPALPDVSAMRREARQGHAAAASSERLGNIAQARAQADDKQLLDAENFDPDAYLKLKLANSTEAELKSLQSSLRGAKDDTAVDLQRNVFKNYAEFVLISKEISSLENEMMELKESLSEYKSMPSLLHVPDPTTLPSSTLSSYKRSSVADLRIMYYNQMQSLHAEIEGSAKFLPIVPGRHVVSEAERILALNNATYKVTGKVKFIILDDAVLVARRRRRNATGGDAPAEGKLVAEKCYNMNGLQVVDTKDSSSMTNVFKMKVGKSTDVYRLETSVEKKTLLAQLRNALDEWLSKKRQEREGEHERRKSLWNSGGDRSSAFNPDQAPEWMADLAAKAGAASTSDAKQRAERDAQWIGDWSDDLTVAIALKEWEKAVTLIETGKEKATSLTAMTAKLASLTAELTNALLGSLSLPSNRKTTTVSLIALLARLGASAAARATFLQTRAGVITTLARKIRFEGHVGAYVGDLAVVYFTGIKHTADWFLASFRENEVASVFIDWAKTQITRYAETFRRQVYSADVDARVVEEAKKITFSQSRKQLEDFGLDFRFLLDELLKEHPKASLDASQPLSFKPAAPVTNPNLTPALRPSASKSTIRLTPNPAPPPAHATPPPPTPPVPPEPDTSAPAASRPRTPPTPSGRSIRSARSLRDRDRSHPPPSTSPSVPGSPAPPPRSTHRPGSSIAQRAVPQREGMF